MKRKTFDMIWFTVIAVIVVLATVGMIMPVITAHEQAKAETKHTTNYNSFTDVSEQAPRGKLVERYFEPMDSLSTR